MLQLDDVQLYDLSEAGGLLFKDPARLSREARQGAIPSARTETGLGLPAPWVEAACGLKPTDPASLCTYWLARLAPPSGNARRPRRDRERLEATDLLTPAEAARRLCASPIALARLEREGLLPPLRVEDEVRHDAVLVDLMARQDETEGEAAALARAAAAARRAEVRTWARFEYGAPEAPRPPKPWPQTAAASTSPAASPAASTAASTAEEGAPASSASPAPKAFEMPADLLEPLADANEHAKEDEAPRPSTLMEIDGFETVDED